MRKTKNESMGVLKLKLEVTPENIESLKSLFLKPENKISNIVSADTMLFNGKSVGKSVEDVPMVATLRTNCGLLQEGDVIAIKVTTNVAYFGIVTRFTENQVFLKNAYKFHVAPADNGCNWTYSPIGNVSVPPKDIVSITKNQ